jgi:hypothetical protein
MVNLTPVKALEKLSDLRVSGVKRFTNSRFGGNQSQDAGERVRRCPRKAGEKHFIFQLPFFIFHFSFGRSNGAS